MNKSKKRIFVQNINRYISQNLIPITLIVLALFIACYPEIAHAVWLEGDADTTKRDNAFIKAIKYILWVGLSASAIVLVYNILRYTGYISYSRYAAEGIKKGAIGLVLCGISLTVALNVEAYFF